MPQVWRIYELRISVWVRGERIFQRVCRFVQELLGTRAPGPLRLIFLVRELNLNWERVDPPTGYAEYEEIDPSEVEDFLLRYIGPSSFVSDGFVVEGPDEAA
jgi:hypothetical protein